RHSRPEYSEQFRDNLESDAETSLLQSVEKFKIRTERLRKSAMGHRQKRLLFFFFFSSRRRHTISVSAFLLNRSSDLVESIARPRRNGERRRAPTASISKESPAITGVVEMVIRRPIWPARKPRWERSCGIRSAPVDRKSGE